MAGDRGDKVLVLVRITGEQRTGTCLGSLSHRSHVRVGHLLSPTHRYATKSTCLTSDMLMQIFQMSE